MGSRKKKKEKIDEKLRQRMLAERESLRIAKRFETLEKEVHRLLTSGDSDDQEEDGGRQPVAVPPTPPLPPPPPWSKPQAGNEENPKYFKGTAQWNYSSSPEGQGATSTVPTGTSTTPVPLKMMWVLLRPTGDVTTSYVPHGQVTPSVPLSVTIDVAGL